MALPFRNILCPIDFDDSSIEALDTAAQLGRQNDGTVFVLHVVPSILPPAGMPIYVDLYQGQEEFARRKLEETARKRLAGLKYDLLIEMADPGIAILKIAKRVHADVIVMATHGRRGFSRFFLGSVAEYVLREAPCPVLAVRHVAAPKNVVSTWMTAHPVTAAPNEKLSSVQSKMLGGGFRCIPVVKDNAVIGILTDRDIREHLSNLEVEAGLAMTEPLITIAPAATVRVAARLLRERKIGALPVVEDGQLVGVITTTDVIDALTEEV